MKADEGFGEGSGGHALFPTTGGFLGRSSSESSEEEEGYEVVFAGKEAAMASCEQGGGGCMDYNLRIT